jgi:hypothetical protein
MKIYKNVQALWQAPAGSFNGAFHTGQALAVRIVPNFSTNGLLGAYLPRTILVGDNAQRNNQISLGDSGWYFIDKQSLHIGSDDSNHPWARTVGPRANLSFGIETVGSALSDCFNVWVAEDLLDILASPAALSQLTRDISTGLYYPIASGSNEGQIQVSIEGSSTVTISSNGAQLFDQTATASSALNSGTINTSPYADIFIRIAGLTPATARGLTVNGVRLDSSVVPIWVPPAIGATITDAEYSMGEAANPPPLQRALLLSA